MSRKHNRQQDNLGDGYVQTGHADPYRVTQPQDRKPKQRRGKRVLKWTAAGVGVLFVAGTLATNGGEETPEAPPAVVETVEPQQPTEEPQAPEEPTTAPEDDGVGVPPPPAEVEELPAPDVDELFVEYVRQETTTLGTVPDATIVEFAESVCAAYDRGATPEDVVGVILQHGTSEAQISDYAVVAGAGVAAYCPEYGDMLVDAAGVSQ